MNSHTVFGWCAGSVPGRGGDDKREKGKKKRERVLQRVRKRKSEELIKVVSG